LSYIVPADQAPDWCLFGREEGDLQITNQITWTALINTTQPSVISNIANCLRGSNVAIDGARIKLKSDDAKWLGKFSSELLEPLVSVGYLELMAANAASGENQEIVLPHFRWSSINTIINVQTIGQWRVRMPRAEAFLKLSINMQNLVELHLCAVGSIAKEFKLEGSGSMAVNKTWTGTPFRAAVSSYSPVAPITVVSNLPNEAQCKYEDVSFPALDASTPLTMHLRDYIPMQGVLQPGPYVFPDDQYTMQEGQDFSNVPAPSTIGDDINCAGRLVISIVSGSTIGTGAEQASTINTLLMSSSLPADIAEDAYVRYLHNTLPRTVLTFDPSEPKVSVPLGAGYRAVNYNRLPRTVVARCLLSQEWKNADPSHNEYDRKIAVSSIYMTEKNGIKVPVGVSGPTSLLYASVTSVTSVQSMQFQSTGDVKIDVSINDAMAGVTPLLLLHNSQANSFPMEKGLRNQVLLVGETVPLPSLTDVSLENSKVITRSMSFIFDGDKMRTLAAVARADVFADLIFVLTPKHNFTISLNLQPLVTNVPTLTNLAAATKTHLIDTQPSFNTPMSLSAMGVSAVDLIFSVTVDYKTYLIHTHTHSKDTDGDVVSIPGGLKWSDLDSYASPFWPLGLVQMHCVARDALSDPKWTQEDLDAMLDLWNGTERPLSRAHWQRLICPTVVLGEYHGYTAGVSSWPSNPLALSAPDHAAKVCSNTYGYEKDGVSGV
ncbi:MAG: hypothetical protein MHM6MM_007860, partial [Cercozoa sp. M6MM]